MTHLPGNGFSLSKSKFHRSESFLRSSRSLSRAYWALVGEGTPNKFRDTFRWRVTCGRDSEVPVTVLPHLRPNNIISGSGVVALDLGDGRMLSPRASAVVETFGVTLSIIIGGVQTRAVMPRSSSLPSLLLTSFSPPDTRDLSGGLSPFSASALPFSAELELRKFGSTHGSSCC